MTHFDSEESRESAVKKGQELLSANDEGAERAILLFDAFVTLGGERTDALVVQGFVYGYADLEVEIIQPYRPFASKGGFAVMQPKVSFPDEHVDQAQALIDAFFRGLDSHEEGGPLWLQSIVASGS